MNSEKMNELESRLWFIIEILAHDRNSIKHRLLNEELVSELYILDNILKNEKLNEGIKDKWEEIYSFLTKYKQKAKLGLFESSLIRINSITAEKIARLITELYQEVLELRG